MLQTPIAHEDAPDVTPDRDFFKRLAKDLRTWAPAILALTSEHELQLQHQVRCLDTLAGTFQDAAAMERRRGGLQYKVSTLLAALRAAHQLRNRKMLATGVERSLQLVLPDATWQNLLPNLAQAVPSPSTVRRHVMALDAALMMMVRESFMPQPQIAQSHRFPLPSARHRTWDSRRGPGPQIPQKAR